MRLGCLNHALLTVEAIRQDGLPIVAWVANCLDVNMRATDENIQTLQQRIPAPCLGVVPFMNQQTPEKFAEYLSLSGLM
jgi:dethiobiotin synthetase